jgi:hypothetical protein
MTNDVLLYGITWFVYQRNTGKTTSYGKPTQWVRHGSYAGIYPTVFLYPTPDAVYNLNISYRKRVPEMIDPTEITLIGEEWDSIIVKMAYVQSLEKIGEYDKSQIEKKELTDLMMNQAAIYDQEEKARREFEVMDPFYKMWNY